MEIGHWGHTPYTKAVNDTWRIQVTSLICAISWLEQPAFPFPWSKSLFSLLLKTTSRCRGQALGIQSAVPGSAGAAFCPPQTCWIRTRILQDPKRFRCASESEKPCSMWLQRQQMILKAVVNSLFLRSNEPSVLLTASSSTRRDPCAVSWAVEVNAWMTSSEPGT